MLTVAIAIAVVVIVGLWITGGVILRLGGVLVAILGALVLAVDHSLAGIILLAVGALLWLAGHWHYVLRHHVYKSPLAQRLFQQVLPGRIDPTRGLGVARQDHESAWSSATDPTELRERQRVGWRLPRRKQPPGSREGVGALQTRRSRSRRLGPSGFADGACLTLCADQTETPYCFTTEACGRPGRPRR